MHENSLILMGHILDVYDPVGQGRSVLDVGSGDVNGSYRQIFEERGFRYVGADIAPGKNVDIVMTNEDLLPSGQYDLVVSGQCLEHARHPWLLAEQMGLACKPGGLVVIIAPWKFKIHRYPRDCWRILPDGMTVLLSEFAGCEVFATGTSGNDCYGVGRKLGHA